MERVKRGWPAALLPALSVIVVLELLALTASAGETDLRFMRGERDRIWYLKTDTLVSPAPGTFSFWNKVVPAKGSPYFNRVGAVLHQVGRKIERLDFVQALQEVDCTAKTSRILTIVYYDKKERIMLTRSGTDSSAALADFAGDAGRVAEVICAEAWNPEEGRYAVARYAPAAGEGEEMR